MQIKKIRNLVSGVLSTNKESSSLLKKEKKCLALSRRKVQATKQAIEIAAIVAQKLQTLAHERISSIVTQCLCDIFDEPTDFRIIWDRKRNKTEGRMVYIKNGNEVDPKTNDGGSALEIAAFATRLADLVISNKPRRRLLILDEPFLALEDKHAERVQGMIMQLHKELKLQVILITHNLKMRSGKVIRIP